jgi:hypothetical protein
MGLPVSRERNVVTYSIIKHNASTITGQAANVTDAVAAVNRAQQDRWSSDGKLFVAVFVGNDTIGAFPMVENGGQWWAPDSIEGYTAPHTFGSLAPGALFTKPGGTTLFRKWDDAHAKVAGSRSPNARFFSRNAVVVPAK